MVQQGWPYRFLHGGTYVGGKGSSGFAKKSKGSIKRVQNINNDNDYSTTASGKLITKTLKNSIISMNM